MVARSSAKTLLRESEEDEAAPMSGGLPNTTPGFRARRTATLVTVPPGNKQGVCRLVFHAANRPAPGKRRWINASIAWGHRGMVKKYITAVKPHTKKVKTKTGHIKIVAAKGHMSRIDQKPRKK
jgi:hypothetical protein